MWINTSSEDTHNSTDKDYYVAFRGAFELAEDRGVDIRSLGASWFVAWLDGTYLAEGPARFAPDHPEYETTQVRLSAGTHVLAVVVHHVGEDTRLLPPVPPMLRCDVWTGTQQIPITWQAKRLDAFKPQVRRINPCLGWIEWCDTRLLPADWQSGAFDDSGWQSPVPDDADATEPTPVTIGPVRRFTHALTPIVQGPLANTYETQFDDIPAHFFLRDLTCDSLKPQGVWRRYDLGRVRLGRPRFVLDLPAGAVVEFAYAETLSHGRVAPYISFSSGPSCNLDHYVARGGEQEFQPLTPRGGRYLEVHILTEPNAIRFVREEYVERCYHDSPEGSLATGDPLLDRIWATGVETYRACTEDAVIDNPTRERGQWTGDVVSVAMDIAAVAYSDLRLLRRGLVQAAQCAREDGLVAGLSPGTVLHFSTYACQWASACVHYYELTGERTLLEELFAAAVNNVAAFEPFITKDGLTDSEDVTFVDWGYVRSPGPVDMACNLHFLTALRSMIRWCDILGREGQRSTYDRYETQIRSAIQKWLRKNLADGKEGWEHIGYHSAALALSLGLIAEDAEADCIEAIKCHMLRCFPNNPDAPRLSDPTQACQQLITPYFAHFALPPLIERGEMDFVLEQYRTCWGWALEDGRTTWVEVFDPRWSHCHEWSGCPTWQLSRYLLGLHARHDLGTNHFTLNLRAGSWPEASGALPLPGNQGLVRIQWSREHDTIRYALHADAPIWLHTPPSRPNECGALIHIEDRHEMSIPLPSGRTRQCH